MAHMTPAQIARRDRVEALIGLAAPVLDLVLAVGDRVSRIVEPGAGEYYPTRPGGRVALPGEPGYDADDPALPPSGERAATDARGG
jgi:hypothetical protein